MAEDGSRREAGRALRSRWWQEGKERGWFYWCRKEKHQTGKGRDTKGWEMRRCGERTRFWNKNRRGKKVEAGGGRRRGENELRWLCKKNSTEKGSMQKFWAQGTLRRGREGVWLALLACQGFSERGRCRMYKYSVVMHELADINLCLRNLDEAPQSTNQSHHANETVHPINTHPAPGSTDCGNTGSVWHPTTQGLFVCLFTCLCVPWQWRISSSGMWALLNGHDHIPGFQKSWKQLISWLNLGNFSTILQTCDGS